MIDLVFSADFASFNQIVTNVIKVCLCYHPLSISFTILLYLFSLYQHVVDKILPQAMGRPLSNLSEHTERKDAFQVKNTGVVLA